MDEDFHTDLPTIVGLGEVLWDMFPTGAKFGGAPANFACAASALAGDQARVAMVSAVGQDALGVQAIAELQRHSVQTDWLAQQEQKTGQVLIEVDEQGQATYEFASDTAWDNMHWNDALATLAERTAVVCFGTLGQRCAASKSVIQSFVERSPDTSIRIFDVNLRPPYWSKPTILESMPLANVLKCNEDELPVIAQLLDLQGSTESLLIQLQDRFEYRLIALTLGGEGSILVDDAGRVDHVPATDTEIVDTVGAGDSLTAAIAMGLLQQIPLAVLHPWASRVAAYVCSQPGATPNIPESLRAP